MRKTWESSNMRIYSVGIRAMVGDLSGVLRYSGEADVSASMRRPTSSLARGDTQC